jgi:membrane-associated phospholipid phosphatase
VKDSQHALYEVVTNYVAAHGHAEIACGAAFAATALVGVGWFFHERIPAWLSVCARAVGLLWGVAILAGPPGHGGQPWAVDRAVSASLIAHRSPTTDHAAIAVGNILGPAEIAGLAAVAALAVGLTFRSWLCGLTVVATVGGAASACWFIDLLVGRARPPIAVQEALEWGYSIPSGYVTATAALLGILVVGAGIGGGRRVTTLVTVITMLAVLAMAFSRVYLGMQWLTDVISGVLLAAAAVTVGASALHVLADRASFAAPAIAPSRWAASPTGALRMERTT